MNSAYKRLRSPSFLLQPVLLNSEMKLTTMNIKTCCTSELIDQNSLHFLVPLFKDRGTVTKTYRDNHTEPAQMHFAWLRGAGVTLAVQPSVV